jgi:hypothetical protein
MLEPSDECRKGEPVPNLGWRAILAADDAGYSPLIGAKRGTLSGRSDPITCNRDSISLGYLRNPEHRKLLEDDLLLAASEARCA